MPATKAKKRRKPAPKALPRSPKSRPRRGKHTLSFCVSMDPVLLKKVDRCAKSMKYSRSAWISRVCEGAVRAGFWLAVTEGKIK